MKKLIIILILLSLLKVEAQEKKSGINFFKGSFEEALKLAQKENKPLFVDFYAVWCGPCKRMEKTVFPQEKVGKFFNEKFINLQIDAEKPNNIAIAKRYKVAAFPTIGFIAKDGKAITINVGAMNADQLLEAGKVAVGETIGFKQMYSMYRKDKKNLELQQSMLLQAPRFLAAQDGMDAEKWIIRVQKLYRNYIKKKMGEDLINKKDYVIISTLSGNTQSEKDEMTKFINDNLNKWKKAVGNPVCYYVIENNDEKMEKLAKDGNKDYKEYLEKINGEYKDAYSVLSYKNITPYEKANKYYNALYSIYNEEDINKYISLMTEYFEKLGNEATPNDYGKASQDLYYAAGDKLKTEHHKKAISWTEKALKVKTNIMDRINYLVMIGDSYKELKEFKLSEKYYNQAYAESLQMTKMEMAQQMIQATLMRKRAELQLLQK